MPVKDPAKAEAKLVEVESLQKARLAIRREWQRRGYDAHAHLRGMTAQGEENVLRQFYNQERFGAAKRNFAAWLAVQDMYEQAHHLRYRSG